MESSCLRHVRRLIPYNAMQNTLAGMNPSLGRANGDHADDDAIDGRKNPTLPASPPDQNCGKNGQYTGKIIEAKQRV